MKFVSDDGKMVFDTMEECEEYEEMTVYGKKILQFWDKYVSVYDNEGAPVELLFFLDNDVHVTIDKMVEIVTTELGSFIKITCDDEVLCEEVADWFSDYAGVYFPRGKGLWRWGTYADGETAWVSLDTDIREFERKWGAIGAEVVGIDWEA